jgi:hypothetical protein
MWLNSSLIPAAEEIVNKLTKYLILDLEKPAAICAMILDPQNKFSYFEKKKPFLDNKIPDMTPEPWPTPSPRPIALIKAPVELEMALDTCLQLLVAFWHVPGT